MRLLRIALEAVLFFLLLAVVLGIGADETGVLEKLVLAAIAAGLIWVAFRVRHLGSPHGPHSA
jgi:ABC-type transport system involved in cytochrome c biogenesis permease component